eukprot:3313015-Heterocapsa_arctica.AAC.1
MRGRRSRVRNRPRLPHSLRLPSISRAFSRKTRVAVQRCRSASASIWALASTTPDSISTCATVVELMTARAKPT